MRRNVTLRCAFAIAAALMLGGAALAAAPAVKPEKLLSDAVAAEAKLKDYHLMFRYMELNDKGKAEEATYEFWFMKPKYIKMNVEAGANKGVKLAYNPDKDPDRIRIKRGIIPLPSMSTKDKQLKGFMESSWGADLADVQNMTKGGKFKLRGTEKIEGRDANVIEVATAPNSKFSKIVIWLDKKNSMFLQYEYYDGTVLKQKKTWFNIETDKGLKSEDFKP